MPVTLRPNSEQVAIAWLSTIPGGTADVVATTLPAPAQWIKNGAVILRVIGGSPAVYLPVASPVLQIDCYANKTGSGSPPWPKANLLAEQIRAACLDRHGMSRPLALSTGGVAYPLAVVENASMLTEPRRGYADKADYALYSFDLHLTWKTPGEVIA